MLLKSAGDEWIDVSGLSLLCVMLLSGDVSKNDRRSRKLGLPIGSDEADESGWEDVSRESVQKQA